MVGHFVILTWNMTLFWGFQKTAALYYIQQSFNKNWKNSKFSMLLHTFYVHCIALRRKRKKFGEFMIVLRWWICQFRKKSCVHRTICLNCKKFPSLLRDILWQLSILPPSIPSSSFLFRSCLHFLLALSHWNLNWISCKIKGKTFHDIGHMPSKTVQAKEKEKKCETFLPNTHSILMNF